MKTELEDLLQTLDEMRVLLEDAQSDVQNALDDITDFCAENNVEMPKGVE